MKHYFLKAVLFIMGWTITNITTAQEVLSLQVCKEKALDHNQQVKTAMSAYNANEAALKISKRAHLPVLDFSMNYTYLNDPNQMVVPGYELPTIDGQPSGVWSPGNTTNMAFHNSYSAALGVSLPLYLGGKLRYARNLSTMALDMAGENVALTQTDLLLNVEKQYWGLVALQERKRVIEKSIEFLNDVVKEVNNWYETGIVTKNEVLKTQVELNNSHLSLIELNNNIELAKMSLNQSIGNGILSTIQVQDSLIAIPNHLSGIKYNEQDLTNRPEIKMLSTQVNMTKEQKKMVNADYLPQLVSYANFISKNPNRYSKQENEMTFNAGASLSIPVFHWGEKRLNKYKQTMTIQQAEYNLDQTSEMLTLEIQQAIFRLRESLVKLDFTQTSLEQAKENLKLETNHLKEGITTTRELLNAQLQWQVSHADFIQAKTAVKINEAAYYKSIGQMQL